MNYGRVMVDIETMDVHESRSLVLTVGVVEFALTQYRPELGRAVLWRPDLLEQLLLARSVSRETQLWWQRQSEEARQELRGPTDSLGSFAYQIKNFVGEREVWANGICFDLCNVVELCVESVGERPWPYNAARDARTIYRVCAKRDAKMRDVDVTGVIAHSALSDCATQIQKLWQHWPSLEFDEDQT